MASFLTRNTGKPYFVFDDFFDDQDARNAVKEFDNTIIPSMRRGGDDGATQDGVPIKNTNSCFLNEVYQTPQVSSCFHATRKYHTPEFYKHLAMNHWLFEALSQHNLQEAMQFIYYESNDHYGDHYDSVLFTFLWWLAPDGIEGGDLILEGSEKIDFKHNRVVVFPVQMKHGVVPVTSENRGRYCVSNFVGLFIG